MKKEVVRPGNVQERTCLVVKDNQSKIKVQDNAVKSEKKHFLKLKITKFHPRAFKEFNLIVLGYFYVPN
jgi:hypothetical protein